MSHYCGRMPIAASRVSIRPFRRWDRRAYVNLRRANSGWLDRWEARDPRIPRERDPDEYARIFNLLRTQHRQGISASYGIFRDRTLVGHVGFAPVLWGATMQAGAGYWVSEEHAGQGIAPIAVAKGIDEMLFTWGMHRIEVLVQEDNAASLSVVHKLGLASEGVRRSAMFVDGRWRDHRVFAVTADEVLAPGVLLRALGGA